MKRIFSVLLVISLFFSAFSMLTFAVQAPNVVKEYTFSSGAEGWYVLGGGTLSSGGGAI